MARYADKQNLLQLVGKAHDTYAPKESPVLTGEPESTTPPVDSRDERIATTRYVRGALATNADCTAESDGSTAGPIVELTAKGHAEQFTTTGKNLLDSSFCTNRTQVEVTSQRNTADGSITLTGTESDRYRWWNSSDTLNLTLPAGTYTLSPSYVLMSPDGGTSNIKNGTFTISEATTFMNMAFRLSGLTLPTTCYPQLELGSTATAYEPYTGGAPSPSPDYPQEIQVVRGRNLFGSPIDHSLAGNNVDGYQISTVDGGTSFVAKVKNNTTYTIRDYSEVAGNRFRIVSFIDEPTTTPQLTAKQLVNSSTSRWYTFNSGNANWIVLTTDADSFRSDTKAQLECGFVANGYIPHGDYVGLEVQGKNLLDSSFFVNRVNQGLTSVRNADGSISLSGTSTAIQRWMNSADTLGLTLPAGTYTLSPEQFRLYTGSRNVKGTFTLEEDTTFVNGYLSISNNTYYDTTLYLQLERNDHATAYQPYYRSTTPIPLPSRGWVAGLPDGTADTLTLDGAGKVTWERKTELKDDDFSVSSVTNVDSDSTVSFIAVNKTDGKAISNIAVRNGETYRRLAFSGPPEYAMYMRLRQSVCGSTAESINAWLDNNAAVLYSLATPTTEEMGYVDLPEILEGATLSIPELDALNVKYVVSAATLISGHESRIAALEAAIAEIVAGS